ncbi:MAG: hypothetical protein U0R19_07515 [Bryobacteraceae bacterium]
MPTFVEACTTVACDAEIVGDTGSSVSAFANPKSRTFTLPSGVILDVGRFQVAVDNSLFVRGLERVDDLCRVALDFIFVQFAGNLSQSVPGTYSNTRNGVPPSRSKP